MRLFNKVITFTVLLSIFHSFCGVGIFHFDRVRSKNSEIIVTNMYDWNIRSIACAASEEKNPARDYGVNQGVRNDQSGDSGIKEAGFITLTRILSVVAMCILLAWYIRKKMRL